MSLCILTTDTALFPPTTSVSGRLVHILPLDVGGHGIIPPEVDSYSQIYNQLELEFNSILVLTMSDAILPTANVARQAAEGHGGTAKIAVLDSLQVGPGLGILAQIAARKAAAGFALPDVEDYIRNVIPYLFTIICPDNIPLHPEKLDQRVVGNNGEQAGTALSVYLLEEGQFIPYKKVRTQRHLHENLQEFLGEFEKPQRLAYFHGRNATLHTRPLREAASGFFPGIQFNDLELNEPLNGLFGEHTVGLTVLEMPGENRL